MGELGAICGAERVRGWLAAVLLVVFAVLLTGCSAGSLLTDSGSSSGGNAKGKTVPPVAYQQITGIPPDKLSALKQSLASGEAVEIAGYTLSSALASGLEAAELRLPPQPSKAIWFELSTRAEATLAPVSVQRIEQWQAAGHSVSSAVLPAPTFWQTSEIEEAPALLDATLAALDAQAV